MNIKILSTNPHLYSTKRLVEAARIRKHHVEVINHTKCDIVIEKKNPIFYYNGRKITDADAMMPRIEAWITIYGKAVVRQCEIRRVLPTTESQALVRSRD